MRAVVLVGGEGTRLRPLTWRTPKQMLTIADVTMIERVVGRLVDAGIDDVVLSLGFRPDAFIEAFPDARCAGATLTYAVEPEPLDTAGAIRFAAREAGVDETFVVLNGDVLTDLDVAALLDLHRARGAEATIALTPVEDPSRFGVVPTDAEGRVEAFIEKPPRDEAPTNLINAGTYVLEASVLDRIEAGRRVSIEREVFPALVADGRLFAMASDAYWLDTGTHASLLQAALDLLDGRRSGEVAPGAEEVLPGCWVRGTPRIEGDLDGPVLVGDGALVAEGARLERAVVESGASIGSGAVIRDSVVLRGAVVGEGSLVEGSIVGAGAKVGSGAALEELTVVEGGADVAPGSRLRGDKVELPR